ncbi:MAG TPA: GDYXXLXY domain-containing protein [Planctomycetota bacterium]|jgi:uncharacterized membrane-anchored protein
MRTRLFWCTLVLILLVLNGIIASKEGLLRSGQTVTMRLKISTGPRGPSQLTLTYDLTATLVKVPSIPGQTGALVVTLDKDNVAKFVRYHAGEKLADDEHLLRYHAENGWTRVGVESFSIPEGKSSAYSSAQYAEFRVSPNGDAILTGLLGPKFEPLGSQ